MKKLYFFAALLCCISSVAQVNIAPGNTVTQNFDAMGSSSTATLPSGWKANKDDGSVRTVGSYATAGTSTTMIGGNSIATNASAGIYNYGGGVAASAVDRAVGGLSIGSAVKSMNLYVDILNNGIGSINSFTISYDVEKYRNGSNAAGFTVKLYYSLNGTTWIAVGAGCTTSFAGDANSNGYATAPATTVSISSQSLNVAIAPSSHLYLAWNYSVTSGSTTSSAQALGIDNISITALADAPSPVLVAGAVNAFGNVCIGSNSASNSFTLSGSNLNGSQVTVGPLANYTLSGTATGPWTATLSPYYTGSSFSTTIYARFSATAVQSYNGNIPIGGGGAAAINLAVTGAGINTTATITTGSASSITQTSATLAGSITDIGCSAISSYGIEYSTINGFANGTGTFVASSNLTTGNFSSTILGLTAGTVYYYHAVAANNGGTSYGAQESFTTLPVDPIIATAATGIEATEFTANWIAVSGALNYRLDVATTNTFIFPGSVTLANWHFPNLADDAIVDAATALNSTKVISAIGTNNPVFNTSAATTSAARATGWDGGSAIKYWQIEVNTTGYCNLLLSSKQRSTSTGPKDFKAQYKIGAGGTWTDIPSASITVADDYISGVLSNKALPSECSSQPSLFIRWIMTSNLAVGGGSAASIGANLIDDILLTGNLSSCVAGYENLLVNGISQYVDGLTETTTYYYRVRAFDGAALTVNSNVVMVATPAESPLPVSLTSFNAARKDNKNMLRWVTVSENNNAGFEVQRSVDGTNYTAIGFVPAYFPDGNSDERLTYAFNDHHYTGSRQYYRLKQMDKDGRFTFSNIVFIHSEAIATLSLVKLYPNPVISEINVLLDAPMHDEIDLIVTDITGRIVKQKTITVDAGSNSVSVDVTQLRAGSYLLKIISRKENQIAVSRFIKQ